MNNTPPTSFDGVAGVFDDYGKTLRGYVRYELVRRNLKPFITKKPMRVLDIGGGGGSDAVWLAERGHNVTILEPSKQQREYARRRINFFLTSDQRAGISVVAGGLSALSTDQTDFDVVLLHGVAMYQAKPLEFIEQAVKHCKPKGLLSILEKGYYGAEARIIRQQDAEALKSLHRTRRAINHLDQNVYAFLPDELETVLSRAGAKVEQWTGIRLITDDQYDNVSSMDQDFLEAIIETEYQQGHNPAIRGQGQLLHFIARKQ